MFPFQKNKRKVIVRYKTQCVFQVHYLLNLGRTKVRDFFNSLLKATIKGQWVSKFSCTRGEKFEKFENTRVPNTSHYKSSKIFDYKTEFRDVIISPYYKKVFVTAKLLFSPQLASDLQWGLPAAVLINDLITDGAAGKPSQFTNTIHPIRSTLGSGTAGEWSEQMAKPTSIYTKFGKYIKIKFQILKKNVYRSNNNLWLHDCGCKFQICRIKYT